MWNAVAVMLIAMDIYRHLIKYNLVVSTKRVNRALAGVLREKQHVRFNLPASDADEVEEITQQQQKRQQQKQRQKQQPHTQAISNGGLTTNNSNNKHLKHFQRL